MAKGEIVRIFGLNLIRTKLQLVGPKEFFRQTQIDNMAFADRVSTGLRVIKDVLWMRLLEESEGMRLPNGCRWFNYIPFTFEPELRIYRFRVNPVVKNIADAYPTNDAWSLHSMITLKKE